jgi:superfamily II DNA or RNA helicase
MAPTFLSDRALSTATWQYLERSVARLLFHEGFSGVRLVGQSGDKGADVLAHKGGKRWLIQVKFRSAGRIGIDVVDETVSATRFYRADVPVIATNRTFTSDVIDQQSRLMASGTPMQLWDHFQLKTRLERLPVQAPHVFDLRSYQEGPVASIVSAVTGSETSSALVVMATGLGKTVVAARAVQEIMKRKPSTRVLVLAHTNELVYQLEKSFWPFLNTTDVTTVWNGYEVPNHEAAYTFACVDSIANEVRNTGRTPARYDMVIIDECHHAGSPMYLDLIAQADFGQPAGPFLLGMTATPWRQDAVNLQQLFGEPVAQIDIVEGLKQGWLSNVDYRMHVDNIDWEELGRLHSLTPKGINRTLFIREWDDGVIKTLREVWPEVTKPRAIVFCGTIDHAITMRDKINALGFGRAEALYSGARGAPRLSAAQRNKILCDFHDGLVDILCGVDILNEGIDLPDVNIVVFQRVTHSRRIFVQQLGRGLRIAEGKDRVIVLDFVSDIRRFAAGIELQNQLGREPKYVDIGSSVRFMNVTGEDRNAEAFLREWLEDVASVESAGDDDSVLKFPPALIDREAAR